MFLSASFSRVQKLTGQQCVFFNKAYLTIQGLTEPTKIEKQFKDYKKTIIVFSENGELLNEDDWASTRGISGKTGDDVLFYVYNKNIKKVLTNLYSYAPIYDHSKSIIGSYVKIGPTINSTNDKIINDIIQKYHLTIAST
jgi:hypothetical protein